MPYYKGHQLDGIANQQEDGQWIGYYVITDLTETVTEENKGPADGIYATREEAEAAAVREGERMIDSHSPLA